MKDKTLTMSAMKSVLKKHRIEIIYYIDRVSFYTDTRTHEDNLVDILNANKKNNLYFKSLEKYGYLDKKINLFQPSKKTLRMLTDNNILSGDYAITYIEFAVDFLVKNKKVRNQLSDFFDKHLFHERSIKKNFDTSKFHFKYGNKCKKKKYCKEKNNEDDGGAESNCICKTRYFTPPTDDVRMAIYSDKRTKTKSKKYCIHIEKRIVGLEFVKKFEIYTFQNIIDFNHAEFWSQNLDIRKPNFSALGRLNSFRLKKTKKDANSKRGKKEWSKFNVLQEYLRDHSHSSQAFQKIDTAKKLESLLKHFL